VLGSHGRTRLASVLIGSVAEAVAAHSRRSLLIVHRSEQRRLSGSPDDAVTLDQLLDKLLAAPGGDEVPRPPAASPARFGMPLAWSSPGANARHARAQGPTTRRAGHPAVYGGAGK
jgi:hypothetical protein